MTGCSQRVLDFTLISSKNVDLSQVNSFQRGDSRIVGKDIKHMIILIPTGIPTIKEALDNAIESTPGAVALADGVIEHHSWVIPLIYGKSWYSVEGTPIIDTKIVPIK